MKSDCRIGSDNGVMNNSNPSALLSLLLEVRIESLKFSRPEA